jgi:hypothetical protein
LLCSYLSAILLVGLLLNATVGWWWADPLAALGIAYLALREGVESWRGGEHDHDGEMESIGHRPGVEGEGVKGLPRGVGDWRPP